MVQEETIKGKLAEAIVRCMFEDLGFEVISYGYENTCPTIAKKYHTIKGDVKNLIRKAPDFIIVDKENNAYFIEVKYRKNGEYTKESDYPFEDCYIILLTGEYIGIEQYKNLPKGKITVTGANFGKYTKGNFKEGGFKSLMDVPLFQNVDKDTVLKYREQVMKYMK